MRTLLPGNSPRLALGAALLLAACGSPDADNFGGGGGGQLTPPTGDGGGGDGGTETDDTGGTGTTDGGTATGDGGTTTGDGGTEIVIEGTGYDAGDTAYDLAGFDQVGTLFSLHALYGYPVLLAVGHMDEPGFQSMMAWLGDIDDARVVAVVGRDEDGVQADQADAASWASTYGVSTVLYDSSGSLVDTWAERNPPKTYVIDAEMVIYWTRFGTVSQVQVQDKIDEL